MITLESIRKDYKSKGGIVNVLDDVNLTICRGEYVAIVGPLGSGKTTLFNILGILDAASSGRYLLEGYDISELSDRERARIRNKHFGFLVRECDLAPGLSALENVMLPMRRADVPYRERRGRAELLLDRMGLASGMKSRLATMSGEARQRVAIARALANDPDVILADEPAVDLPSDVGDGILATFDFLNAQGVTIVMVTESMERGGRAKRVILLRDGKLADSGPSA
jgi:putative ABC transport system ATP-binding protein